MPVFAALVVSGMLVLSACQQPAGDQTGSAGTADTSRVSARKDIVYVDADTIMAKYDFFEDLQKELETQSKQLEQQIQSKGKSFQDEVSSYQQRAAGMTAAERQTTEENLARKQQELQQLQQTSTQQMMRQEQEANEKLHKKVQGFLKKYAAENNYTFILTYSRGDNSVLFADSTLEVTDEVLKGLNEAYKNEKN